MAKLVSKTYGEALFELAIEENTLEAMAEEVQVVLEVSETNKELIKLLNHPKISKEEKISVIEDCFKGNLSETMVGFLVTIVDKGRYNEITDIFNYFILKVKEYKKIGIAFVTSAKELTEQQKNKLVEKLLQTTKYVEFEMYYSIDPALIGGMAIRIGDRVVDGSIRTKISNIAKELEKIQLAQ